MAWPPREGDARPYSCPGPSWQRHCSSGLAARKPHPNTQAVDCNQLLDKELERGTDLGITMNNMLARGQVVPLAMTLELLKGVVNLTASDSLVLENFPMHVDQIDTLAQEFRIDRAFYLSGSKQAVQSWREAHTCNCKAADVDGEIALFDDQVAEQGPIVAHFSKMGMLVKLQVDRTLDTAELNELVNAATKPRYVVIYGPSAAVAGKQAEMLAAALGLGKPVRQGDLPVSFSELMAYANANSLTTVVLDRLPDLDAAAMAADLVSYLGAPKLVVNITCEDEFLEEEWKAANEDKEFEPEAFANRLLAQRAGITAALQIFAAAGVNQGANVMNIARKSVKTAEEMDQIIRNRLLPSSILIMAPSGKVDIGAMMAETVCLYEQRGGASYTVIDGNQLCQRGGRSQAIEDALQKAAIKGEPQGCLPSEVWGLLFLEAFATSADPMGNFIIINYPPMIDRPGYAIQDQFALLESVTNLQQVLHLKVPHETFSALCAERPGHLEAFTQFDRKLHHQARIRFEHRGCLLNFDHWVTGTTVSEVHSELSEYPCPRSNAHK